MTYMTVTFIRLANDILANIIDDIFLLLSIQSKHNNVHRNY